MSLEEKKNWPREVVEHDTYIMINDWLGGSYAEEHPELVTKLVGIATDYLQAHPDITWETLWVKTYKIFVKNEPYPETTKTGGGIMSPTALEQRLDVVEKISQGLNERVAQADVDGMIETKLQASKLPDKVQVALRGQLLGKQLTEDEVDSFIKFQQGITDDLATELAATAHVTLGGGVLPGEGKDTLEGALTALFEKQA